MRKAHGRSWALLALLLTMACAQPKGLPAAPSPVRRAIEEVRIGVFEGRPEYMFGQVEYLAGAADGSVVVSDRQPLSVRRYDARGVFAGPIGRVGEGPGEYGHVVGVKVLPNGEVALRDVSTGRVNFYSTGGEFRREISVDSGVWGGFSLEYDYENNVYVRGWIPEQRTAVLKRYSGRGEHLGDLPIPETRRDLASGRSFTLVTSEGYFEPFPVVTLSAWSPSGYFVSGRNDVYALECLPTGSCSGALSRAVGPVPFRPAERAEWLAWSEHVSGLYSSRGVESEMAQLREYKPYFRGIEVGDNGLIWVWRYGVAEQREVPIKPAEEGKPPLTWAEPPTFDVFDPQAGFLGTVVLPFGVRALAFRGSRIWGVATDEVGIEYVVRLHVEPPWE